FTYAPGKTVRVTSSPIDPDSDGDGLSDLTEKTLHESDPAVFPYHPRVHNPNPLAIYPGTDDVDGVVRPGDTLVYTATVSNELTAALYAQGDLSSDFPSVLGTGDQQINFNLFRGQSAVIVADLEVDEGSGSQIATIDNSATAIIQPSQYGDPQGLGTVTNGKAFDVVIDDDAPTSALTTPPFVMPGGVRVLGGTATDPTSQVAYVEVQVDDGEWQQAQGSGAWAYAWDVPDSAGSYTLRTRAVDVVGNVQSPVSVYTVEVDSTPP